MQHTVTRPSAAFSVSDGALSVHQVPVAQDNLSWVLACTKTSRAWVVDGPWAAEVLAFCAEQELTLVGVLNTHTHFDHIGVNRDLEKRGLLDGMEVYGSALVANNIPGLTHPVTEGDTFKLGEAEVRVMLTEGHIDGHITFVVDGAVFCGDTLFAGGCGFLADGPPSKMLHSLLRLAELPGDTKVCCAHEYTKDNLRFAWMVEPDNADLAQRIRDVWAVRSDGGCAVPSTIEEERATNPFMRPGSPSLRRNVHNYAPDARLHTHLEVFTATRSLKDTRLHRTQPEDALPL
ncbi:MAG: hydroxyacylglutathione hydrolase [Kiritimatiellia bacterium]|jgi:hydroxyacylglutathione hydrolase